MSSNVLPPVRGSSRTATSTAATSSRGMLPRPVESAIVTRPVPGVVGEQARPHDGRCQRGAGPRSLRRQPLSRAGTPGRPDRPQWPAGRRPSPRSSDSGSTPAASAASASRIAASRSTVSLRAAPLPGPAPAANTTASAPRRCSATSSAEARSRSTTSGFGARRFQGRGLGRLADDSGDGVAAPREQPFEVKGDLAVSACDDNAHWIPLSVGAQRRWGVRAPVVVAERVDPVADLDV